MLRMGKYNRVQRIKLSLAEASKVCKDRRMGAPSKADWREERRKRAWKLKELGWQHQDIATALGVSEGVAVVAFLQVLLRKIRGKILIIWDGSPIHRAHEIKGFLKRGTAKRLHLEQLPGYAPDLNPDEGIWNDLKRVELGNVCCTDLDDLSAQLIRAKERLRLKRAIIRSCSRQCGYSV